MRARRIRGRGQACYHVMSRIVDRTPRMGEVEKRRFLDLMRSCGEFAGVEIHTYALMDNHFHILLQEPGGEPPDEAEVLRRMRALYGPAEVRERQAQWAAWRAEGRPDLAEADLDALRVRMGDVSEYMKTLKQRFTQWYNRRNRRKGTLWEERYKSVLVEDGDAFRIMATYIEHNPVRAGLVERPEDYRWCGRWRPERTWDNPEPSYPPRAVKEIAQSLADGDRLSLPDLLACRVRHLTDGAVFGTQEFVEDTLRTAEPTRKTAPRSRILPLPATGPRGLFAGRRLRGPTLIPSDPAPT